MTNIRSGLLSAVCGSLMVTALLASASAGAAVVNLDGVTNASLDGSTAVSVTLGPGTYSITPVDGQYEAFTRFSTVGGCVSDANCSTGWEWSLKAQIGSTTLGFGDGGANGGIGPISGGGYFATAGEAFTHATPIADAFTLPTTTTVNFFIYDDILTDNSGGVSFNVSSVPEPAAWGAMLLGLGIVGVSLRARRRKVGDALSVA